MLSYILSRLVALALSLVVASLVIFVMIELVPGDPASFMLGLNAAPDTVAALRAELGLGGSPVERYFRWVGGMLQGDFGTSYTYRAPVAELVTARLAVSLPLALMALLLSTLIAIPVGLYAASRRGRPGDWSVMGLTQLGIAIPNFWFAMILVVIFAINLRWFSAGGFPGRVSAFRLGQMPWSQPGNPPAENQRRLIAKITTRIIANQKFGMAMPSWVSPMTLQSPGLPRRLAA